MPSTGPASNKSLKVSIVTVVLNSKHLLEETIKSVVRQTWPEIDYIVIDGGSTDGTLEVIDRFRDHISTVVSEPDQGVYDAMNKSLRYCQGEILYFLNAGDMLYNEDIVSIAMREFTTGKCDFVYGDVVLYDSSIESGVLRRSPRRWKAAIKRGGMICHQAMFVRKSLMKAFDTRYRLAADYDFLCGLGKKDVKSVYVRNTICNYKVNGLSSQKEDLINEKCNILQVNYGKFNAIKFHKYQRLRSLLRRMLRHSRQFYFQFL